MERRRLQCGLTVDVATTEAEWQRGLSGRTEWREVDGMLFIFDRARRWPVYMHDMACDLHAYWLDGSGLIVAETWMPQASSVYYLPILDAYFLLETRMPMPWRMGDQILLRAQHDAPRPANAHSGAAERIDNGAAVLEHDPDR